MSPTPLYVAFEGIDGSGKSTQARLLAERLGAVLTRENGGTPVGERIRAITHDLTSSIHPLTEVYLFAADRAQHFIDVVVPAIRSGRSVVSDRSVFSSLAYQGFGRQLGMDLVWDANELIERALLGSEDWIPEVVFYLDIPLGVRAERLAHRSGDRIEREDEGFVRRVVDGYAKIARQHYTEWHTIDGTRDPGEIAAEIYTIIEEMNA